MIFKYIDFFFWRIEMVPGSVNDQKGRLDIT